MKNACIKNTEDHVHNIFTVELKYDGKYRGKFESVMAAQNWLEELISSSGGEVQHIEITTYDIYITPKKTSSYESRWIM